MLKVWELYNGAYRPVRASKETELELRLSNGSRLVALPGTEKTVRTYNNVALLIVDEAARVEDGLYKTVRPMLAVSGGKLLALSTPFGRRGWFWEAWDGKDGNQWDRYKITAYDCPRIPAAFLESERSTLGELWFRQEYLCDFVTLEGAEWPPEYFTDEMMFDDWPLQPWLCRVLALDPSKGRDSKSGDYAALVELRIDMQGHLWCDCDAWRGRSAEYLASTAVEAIRQAQPDAVAIEANQWLQLFAVLVTQEAQRQSVLAPVVELQNSAPKDVRIRRLGPYLHQKRVHVRNTPGGQLLVQQLREFPEGEHDDAPDALEMALRVATDVLAVKVGRGR